MAIAAAGSLYAGYSGYESSKKEASLQKAQGEEATREASVNAANEAYNQTQMVEKQRLAFLANGVSLEGSPSMVLASSKAYGQQQVNEILRQGQARAGLAYGEAAITQQKGTAALLSGITGAAGDIYKLNPGSPTGGSSAYANLMASNQNEGITG